MQPRRASLTQVSLPVLLFAGLMLSLWIAGGASRGDALGQVISRIVAWIVILTGLILGRRPDFGTVRPVLLLVTAIVLVPLAQMIPLPPSWGVGLLGQTPPPLVEQPLAWRPLTVVPGATLNSFFSLVVPAAALLVFGQMTKKDHRTLLSVLLVFVITAVLFGLLQFSGTKFNNPFINDVPGMVSSIFANRNHFALLVAMGCVLTPVWALADREALRWRGPLAAALVVLFILTIIATGSRSGLLLAALALLISTVLVGHRIRRRLRNSPPWLFPALVSTAILIVAGFIGISFFADRVPAIDRLFELAVEEDLRIRSRTTIFEIIAIYFPFGAGFGSFDAVFRLNEPTSLLALQYFNQAHNDYLGVVVESGLIGLTLFALCIGWWAYATVRVLRASDGEEVILARLGSALLALVLVASVTDYPARTPTIMAIVVIAGCWLAHGSRVCGRSTLRQPTLDV